MIALASLLSGCTSGTEAVLTLSTDSPEARALEGTAEVRILRGGMDQTIDEPDALDAFIDALAVEFARYDAEYPDCMPTLWISLSDDSRQPLASVVFCEDGGAGAVTFAGLGTRTVSPQRGDRLRRLATETLAAR